eukprot:scaffold126747_cov35-Tisochrysis_lutea.AAC.2
MSRVKKLISSELGSGWAAVHTGTVARRTLARVPTTAPSGVSPHRDRRSSHVDREAIGPWRARRGKRNALFPLCIYY